MIDFRLYRLAFAPSLLAVVAVMFSLEGAPEAVEPATPPATFDGDRALALAREVATTAPVRTPGSAGDSEIAELVTRRFDEIRAGAVSEQVVQAEFEGEEVSLRNVLLTLPGDPNATVVVLAARDSARGPGAVTTAAATGVLIELANALGVTEHAKTYVLASTSGSAAGSPEVIPLIESLPGEEGVEAAIVISQPGAGEPRPPFVVTSSTAETTGPVQLERTAELAVETQAQESSSEPSAFGQLARLAIPSGLGPQAPLIAADLAALAISSAGERPPEESADGLDDLSGESLDGFGRAIQSTVDAVDTAPEPLDRGPRAHLELSENLIPGWSLALLALTLILPAAVAAVDAGARVARGRAGLGVGLAWAAARSLPFVGALLALYALAFAGSIPSPEFPFDPGLHEPGTGDAVALAAIVTAGLASAFLLRRRGGAAARAPRSAVPGLGLVAAVACLLVWLANPYLALLLAPTAHLWLLVEGAVGPLRRVLAVVAAALACVPVVAALVSVSSALELGGEAPWTFVLMVADGQLSLAIAVPACFVAGSVAGTIALAVRRLPADV